MAKILSIVWYKVLPAMFGGQKGIALFNQQLAAHYPVVCACSSNNQAPADLPYKVLPVLPAGKWQFINPFIRQKIKTIARGEKANILMLEHPYHAWAAYATKKATGAKLIVHSHNIESQRFKQIGKWWWPILARYEKWIHRQADLNIFKTATDMDYAVMAFKLNADKCIVVPYGVEQHVLTDRLPAIERVRQRHHLRADERILLFAGTLDYSPNAKAVEAIYKELAPRLEKESSRCRIIICGRNRFASFQYLRQLSHPLVIQAGEVADIAPYFQAADVFINPTSLGGGIQTKNLDALSWHCSVVCFKDLVEKDTLAVAPGKIFTANTGNWNDFIEKIHIAIHAPAATPPAFFKQYSWENSIRPLVDRIATLDFTFSLQDRS